MAKEIIPTNTMRRRFLVTMAAKKVGNEANKYSRLRAGRCPKCGVKRLLNHKVVIITIGTKSKNSTNLSDRWTYFNNTNGKTRDKIATMPQQIIVRTTLLNNMF